MTHAPDHFGADPTAFSRLPSWIAAPRGAPSEDMAFLSGAALGHLHLAMQQGQAHLDLLRARLALRAAEVCATFAGRPERAGALRDELCLLRPGDRPGPAGEIYLGWQRATERPLAAQAIQRALPHLSAETIAAGPAQGAPVARAARVLEAVLDAAPREEAAALILADAALARAMGWRHLLPLLAVGIRRADLRRSGDELRLACHRAGITAAADVVRMAADLGRRAARVQAVAPKLRAKGAAPAVEMFLTRDAVAPAMLTGFMSDRAARRLCDRLVSLGVVRELTGRESFRLYGV